MLGKPQRNFVPDPKYPTPESAARELLRLYREPPTVPYAYTGVTNTQFTRGGGTIAEYRAGIEYGIAQGWFSIEAGSRVTVLLAKIDSDNPFRAYNPCMGSSAPYCPKCRRPMATVFSGRKKTFICQKCSEDPLKSLRLRDLIRAVRPPEDDSENPPPAE